MQRGISELAASWLPVCRHGSLPLGEKSPVGKKSIGGGRGRERGITEAGMGRVSLGTGAINWNHRFHPERMHRAKSSYITRGP